MGIYMYIVYIYMYVCIYINGFYKPSKVGWFITTLWDIMCIYIYYHVV